MIIPDVNLLLYATISTFAEHARARSWWEAAINGEDEIGLPAVTLFGFVRIATNPRIFAPPLRVEEAVAEVEAWLQRSNVRFLGPGPRHLDVAFRLLRRLGTAANLTTDVQLAALAIEHQAELHSADADFSRFDQLRWVNPLA